MKLLTVTCEKDLTSFLIQCESIQKYLEPCTHYVIINEKQYDLNLWKQRIEKYYTNHTLVFLNYDISNLEIGWKHPEYNHRFFDYEGWVTQMSLKYLAFKDIQDDYLILDSKNLFINHTSLNHFKDQIGSGRTCALLPWWDETVKCYSDYFNVKPKEKHLSIDTPFVFHKTILDKIENYDDLVRWYVSQPVMPSDFLLYSYLTTFSEEDISRYKTFWDHDELEQYNLLDLNNYLVVGFHRQAIGRISKYKIDEINQFLKLKGIHDTVFV